MEHETGVTELLGREWFKREIYALDRLEEESQKKKEKEKKKKSQLPNVDRTQQQLEGEIQADEGELLTQEEMQRQDANFSTPPSSRPLSQESQESTDPEPQPVMSPQTQSPKRKRNVSSPTAKRRRSTKEPKEGKEAKEKKKQSSNSTILQFFSKRVSHLYVCFYLFISIKVNRISILTRI